MATNVATFTVDPLTPAAVAIRIGGDVTNACEQNLMSAHEKATEGGAKRIVLDFAGMNYMNSGGIGMLVTLLVRAQRRRQTVAAIGLTDHYRQIFQLTRLDEAIGLFDTADAAIGG
jgi:anti-sigma B factor antagonist